LPVLNRAGPNTLFMCETAHGCLWGMNEMNPVEKRKMVLSRGNRRPRRASPVDREVRLFFRGLLAPYGSLRSPAEVLAQLEPIGKDSAWLEGELRRYLIPPHAGGVENPRLRRRLAEALLRLLEYTRGVDPRDILAELAREGVDEAYIASMIARAMEGDARPRELLQRVKLALRVIREAEAAERNEKELEALREELRMRSGGETAANKQVGDAS